MHLSYYFRCNLLEEPEEPVEEGEGKAIHMQLKPFEVVTYLIFTD